MLALPLLVTTLTLAPTGGSSRFELTVGGQLDLTPIIYPSAVSATITSSGLSIAGSAGAGFTVFGRRVVDDDAPPALQPFLQRAAELHIDGGGGGFHFLPPSGAELVADDGSNGYVDVSASAYFARYLYAQLSAGVRYSVETTRLADFTRTNTNTLGIPLGLAVGPRFGDVRIILGWSVEPVRTLDDSFKVPFWGEVSAQVYAVVRRCIALDAEIDVLEGGAGAVAGVTFFPARRFGIGAFARGSHIFDATSTRAVDHAGGVLRFETWVNPRVAVAVEYDLDWDQFSEGAQIASKSFTNVIDLSIRLRPR
ncbi:MAG TPA: hypothetical protein VGL86_20510 [Polyangia bacterium]|jgi:hypothetical protein